MAELLLGNMFDLLPGKWKGKVDLVFTDPPYLISKKNKKFINYMNPGHGDVNLDFGEWDYEFDLEKFVDIVYDLLNEDGQFIVWTSEQLSGKYRDYCGEKGMHVKQTLIWVKTNPIPNALLMGYRQSTEMMLWVSKNKLRRNSPNFNFLNQQRMTNVFYAPIVGGKERLKTSKQDKDGKYLTHPTQKPLSICRDIIINHSKQDGLVIDPFMGVGTIPLSAINERRDYVGVEIDPDYYNVAVERLKYFEKWTNYFPIETKQKNKNLI